MAYRFISRDIARSSDSDAESVNDVDVEIESPSETYEIVFDATLASTTGIVTSMVVGSGIAGWATGIGTYALMRKFFSR